MKVKIKKDLLNKEIVELKKMLDEKYKELTAKRLDQSMFKLKNTRSLFHARKEIASILTIIKVKEMKNDKNI